MLTANRLSHRLDALLVRKADLHISIGHHARCQHHAKRNRYCSLVLNKEEWTTELIHCKSELFEVKNYQWYCAEYQCRKYNILQHSKYIICDDSSTNVISLNGKPIFKNKSKFVTYDLLSFFTECTINSDSKYVGMNYI